MKLLFIVVLIVITASVYFYPTVMLWLDQDSCLDQGGAFLDGTCIFK
ncbi:MAG: hypothetical protein OXR68_08210 [Alphaproteobacteria bacterium]|nr:hypothetical protein [Alphaproteobacteria bacterium]MDD9920588.1 hypothetical protein [Alphaproteobacteria bacterium]